MVEWALMGHGTRVVAAGVTLLWCLGACNSDEQRPSPEGEQFTEEDAQEDSAGGERNQVTDDAWLVDVSEEVGLVFHHDAGAHGNFYFPEIMGSGGAWIDGDQDGDLDAYLIQGGILGKPESDITNRYFRNENGIFEEATEASGLGDAGYGMGCCVGDVNNDGYADVYVTNVGRNRLYLNQGDGTFTDTTERADVGHEGWGTSCTFLDDDGDGWLDLFLVNYVRWQPELEKVCRGDNGDQDYCSPTAYDAPAQDILYRNRGDGTFEDVTQQSGIHAARGNGLGVVAGDFDDDGRTDLYVANDQTPNQLWFNEGNGRFKDEALVSGTAYNEMGLSEAGMGVDAADFDNDGDLDLWITHLDMETHTFYRNLGGRVFRDETVRLGVARWSLKHTGFGTMLFDCDHDGLLDVFVANGRVVLDFEQGAFTRGAKPFAEADTLARQTPEGRLMDVSDRGGSAILSPSVGRGAMFGDYDGDGDLDILVTRNRGAAALLRNDAPKSGSWLRIRAVSGEPPRDAIGAAIFAELAGGSTLRRDVRPGAGYCGSNAPEIHMALNPTDTITRLRVRWPDGSRETFTPPDLNTISTLRQGSGQPDQEPDA